MDERTFTVSGTVPKDWFLMCLSETVTGAQAGDWYCCFRKMSGEAASSYGITAQKAYDCAVLKAINYGK